MLLALPPALLGGTCLGAASAAVLAQTGGILGISGIVGRVQLLPVLLRHMTDNLAEMQRSRAVTLSITRDLRAFD